MTGPKKGKPKPPKHKPKKPHVHNQQQSSRLLSWGRGTIGFVLAILAILGAGDLLHDQYEKTKPVFRLGASDSAPKPSLPFTVENRSAYFPMRSLYLDCAGQISFKEGKLIIVVGQPTFDSMPKGRLGQISIINTDTKPMPAGTPIWLNLAFGGPHPGRAESGNFRVPDMTSERADLEPTETRRFPCGQLLAYVSGDFPIVAAKIKVRVSYQTHLMYDFDRTAESLVYSCTWKDGKFQCDDGEQIALDFP